MKSTTILLTVVFQLLFITEVTAEESDQIPYNLHNDLPECEETVVKLNTASEILDLAGSNAGEKMKHTFQRALTEAIECTADLSEETNKEYTVSKDWFGSDYTLNKPFGWQDDVRRSKERAERRENERAEQWERERREQKAREIAEQEEERAQEAERNREWYREMERRKQRGKDITPEKCVTVFKYAADGSELWRETGKDKEYWRNERGFHVPQSKFSDAEAARCTRAHMHAADGAESWRETSRSKSYWIDESVKCTKKGYSPPR